MALDKKRTTIVFVDGEIIKDYLVSSWWCASLVVGSLNVARLIRAGSFEL